MDNWISIATDQDVKLLLSLFGGFHDSCIRDAHIWTGHFVNPDLAMTVESGLDTCASILVQRQSRNPSCIELRFEQVTRINLVPSSENYNSVIYSASLTINENGITWAIDPENDLDASEDTWITAKILKYRVADEFLGPSESQLR